LGEAGNVRSADPRKTPRRWVVERLVEATLQSKDYHGQHGQGPYWIGIFDANAIRQKASQRQKMTTILTTTPPTADKE
jgi:hypothetical protein